MSKPKYSEAQYRNSIKEGMWIHVSKNDAPALDVIGVDWVRKQVYLPNDVKMGFDELLDSYCATSDWASRIKGDIEHGGAQNSILGGLDKESDIIKNEVEKPQKVQPILSDDLVQLNDYEQEFKQPVSNFTPVKVDKSSSEYRMISDAINLSSDKDVTIESTFDITIPFDINKVAKMANMFDISSDKIADIILSDENGINTLSAILVAVVESVKNKN